ncbi:glycosyltransferase [Mesoflavibacter sp. CH_XMU1404-2]|uniref:glycosyltransferase family 2 protein n=1 Tax=Mesoflavibacter sp. CH_XMU1404-2 TaxID=3107766 RepID=UPI00243AD91A
MEIGNNNNIDNVSIVIVNYNCWNYTIDCISSLLKSTYNNFNLFIVDNSSTDNSVLKLKEWSQNQQLSHKVISAKEQDVHKHLKTNLPLITIVESKLNNGFGAGNNIVLKPLTHSLNNSYVWLLNPDTEVEKNVLKDLVSLAKGKKKTIVGNIIHYYNKREEVMYCGGFKVKRFIHGVIDIKKEEDIDKLDAIAGASLFTNINTFKNLGVLPEDYFMYWEETDFCKHAKNNNYNFIVNTRSKVFDHVGATSKSNFLREYLYLLNGLKFYKKYYLMYLPIILISTLAKYIKALFVEDKIKQSAIYFAHIDFFKIVFGKKVNVLKRIQSQKNE